MYDVVHQNIIFEAQLKDGGALDLPSGMLRVLCVDEDMLNAKNLHLDLFLHLEPLDWRAMVWIIRIRWLV